MRTFPLTALIIITLYALSGCTAAVVGGAVVGTSVALDKRTTGDYVEDQSIKSKLSHLYYEDKELSKTTHINITSYNRWVLITGEVATEQQKQQLTEMINKVKNVRNYFNEVAIANVSSMGTRTNDSFLTSKIKTAIFSKMKELNGAQVKVVTESSSVFLMGLVTPEQGNQITEIARTTRGVKRVIKLFEYQNPNDKRI